jgi:hypothetical protein
MESAASKTYISGRVMEQYRIEREKRLEAKQQKQRQLEEEQN